MCGGGSTFAANPPPPPGCYNTVQEFAPGVGGHGGTCTCPDGSVYQVGDNYDNCGSLACEGGVRPSAIPATQKLMTPPVAAA